MATMDQVNDGGGKYERWESLSVALHSSSTSRRRSDLQALRSKILEENLSTSDLEHALDLLLHTYPVYRDRGSRRAVQDCLLAIIASAGAPACFSKFVRFLGLESSKLGIAPSNAFVLVEWFSLALQKCAENSDLWKSHGVDLILPYAQMVEFCLSSSTTRDTIKQSVIVVTRRGLRRLFTNLECAGNAIEVVTLQLTEKSTLGYRTAVLLGVVAGVCHRLPNKRPIFEGLKPQCVSFWVREIIGSRSVVPSHIATALDDVFSNFVDTKDLETIIVPALEKALLRSPEVVLNDLARPMLLSLPSSIDLADVLATHLLKPLLANLKSTNTDIRIGVISTFAVLVERSQNEQTLEKVFSEILMPLSSSKLATAEHRVLHARMLSMLPDISSSSLSVCNGLASTVLKESNEAALAAETNALTRHLSFRAAQENSNFETIMTVFTKGLSDKRPAFQRIWALRSGDLLWYVSKHSKNSTNNSFTSQVVDMLVPSLLTLYDEVVSNPLPAASTGIVVAGYIVLSLFDFLTKSSQDARIKSLIHKARVHERTFSISPRPSYLLNPRIYTKVSNDEDIVWVIRALSNGSVGFSITKTSSAVADAWIQAFLYFLVAKSIPFKLQKDAVRLLAERYLEQPEQIGKLVIAGIWTWFQNVEGGIKDSAAFTAQTRTEKLYLAVHSICPQVKPSDSEPPVKAEKMRQQLIDMLVLCRPEILPRVSWIEVCLRTGQDPGEIAKMYSNECIQQVMNVLQGRVIDSVSDKVKQAAYNTLAELAFAAPAIITPLLVEEIKANLPADELQVYGPTEFAIARTPEGIAFVDVASKKVETQRLDKNVRDYDTLKWEQEVRSQLAHKKGQEKKLTLEEQIKVKAQLAKEAAIREKVLELEKKMEVGIGIVRGLAIGPPTEAGMWMGPSIRSLLGVIKAGVGLLVGETANQAFIACANVLPSRLGSLRSFIGVATLRALGSQNLPQNLQQEPLGGREIMIKSIDYN